MKTIESRSKAIIEGDVWKVIIMIALPMAIQNLLQAVYSLLDTIFATELGEAVVAAISYISPANELVISIGTGLSVAGTTLIARKIALNENKMYKSYVANALLAIGLVGLVTLMIGLFFSDNLVVLFKVASRQASYAETYLRLFMVFAPLSLINGMYLSIKRADGNSKLIFTIAIINVTIKLILNWFFIYVVKMGLPSLVYSTAITNALIVVYGYYDLFIKSDLNISRSDFKVNISFLKSTAIMGFPIAIEKSVLQFGHLATHYYAEQAGIMAAYGMANRVNNLTLAFLSGVGIAIGPIISQNVAVKNLKRIKEIVLKASLINACIGGLMTFSLYQLIPYIFSSVEGSSSTMTTIKGGFLIIGCATFFWGIMQVMLGTFHGFGKTKYNLIFAMLRLYCVRLPIVIAVYHLTVYKTLSVWIGSGASNVLGSFIAMFIAIKILPKSIRKEKDYEVRHKSS